MQGIAESVGDWYFDRRNVKAIDCAYPCDKTCHNLVFKWVWNYIISAHIASIFVMFPIANCAIVTLIYYSHNTWRGVQVPSASTSLPWLLAYIYVRDSVVSAKVECTEAQISCFQKGCTPRHNPLLPECFHQPRHIYNFLIRNIGRTSKSLRSLNFWHLGDKQPSS